MKQVQQKLVLALDIMGGDLAPHAMLKGAEIALKHHKDVHFILFGQQEKITSAVNRLPLLRKNSTINHTPDVIESDEKPSLAIRRGRNSSMGRTVKAVRNGEAAAAVSCGNTGALMAMSKIALRTLPGIDRPAIGAIMPHKKGRFVMLDLGANVTCDANNLFEFAVMGDAFARSLLEIESPKIGLLNIGSEEMKGHDVIQAASGMLKDSELPLNFYGYVEGDDLGKGVVDVVVTDGFTGNVALKTAEGTAGFLTDMLKKSLTSSILSRLGSLLLMPALKRFKKQLDPRQYNGAMFLGLNGIVVKSHGNSDEVGCANAIQTAIELAKHKVNEMIMEEMVESGHIIPEDDVSSFLDEEKA